MDLVNQGDQEFLSVGSSGPEGCFGQFLGGKGVLITLSRTELHSLNAIRRQTCYKCKTNTLQIQDKCVTNTRQIQKIDRVIKFSPTVLLVWPALFPLHFVKVISFAFQHKCYQSYGYYNHGWKLIECEHKMPLIMMIIIIMMSMMLQMMTACDDDKDAPLPVTPR